MNWRAWRCWFRKHEFTYREVGLDPRYPEASARVLDFFAEQFDGHRMAHNICERCGRTDSSGPVVPDGIGGTITLEEYIDRRYREDVERIARQVEEQRGDVEINVPSLSDQPIPLRDAMNIFTELNIAVSKAERGKIEFSCWNCKAPITVERQPYSKTVPCPKCGKKQRAPKP